MKEFNLASGAWGGLLFCIDTRKMDFLPRITASAMTYAVVFNIGFLMFSFNLTFWEKPMRDFLQKENARKGANLRDNEQG